MNRKGFDNIKIFISWSKERSKEYAIATKIFLESINKGIEVFVSELDINGGEPVQNKIMNEIRLCDKLILCFTKENKKSPWLLFEAGYANGLNKQIIPILFDDDSDWHSWIDNPMNIVRELNFNKSDFKIKLFSSINIVNHEIFLNEFNVYIDNIEKITEKLRIIDVECEELVELFVTDKSFKLENPYFKDRTAHFLTGMESFELYKILIETFLYTGKYFWIYGRKNMKLFTGNFNNLFEYLKEQSYENKLMKGIDFKCLFLDPNSLEIEKAHIDQDIFKNELNTTILRARKIIGNNEPLKECFRLYNNKREEIIIRIDNSIIYAKPNFDANGYPQIMTNTHFDVFSVNSPKGQKCINNFMKVWIDAKAFE